jgi:hypothetical protein
MSGCRNAQQEKEDEDPSQQTLSFPMGQTMYLSCFSEPLSEREEAKLAAFQGSWLYCA